MPKRIPSDPEKEARWAEARRVLEERIAYLDRSIEEHRERAARRRARVRRLTFGIFPR